MLPLSTPDFRLLWFRFNLKDFWEVLGVSECVCIKISNANVWMNEFYSFWFGSINQSCKMNEWRLFKIFPFNPRGINEHISFLLCDSFTPSFHPEDDDDDDFWIRTVVLQLLRNNCLWFKSDGECWETHLAYDL